MQEILENCAATSRKIMHLVRCSCLLIAFKVVRIGIIDILLCSFKRHKPKDRVHKIMFSSLDTYKCFTIQLKNKQKYSHVRLNASQLWGKRTLSSPIGENDYCYHHNVCIDIRSLWRENIHKNRYSRTSQIRNSITRKPL